MTKGEASADSTPAAVEVRRSETARRRDSTWSDFVSVKNCKGDLSGGQSLTPFHVTPPATSEKNQGVFRIIVNLPFLRRFWRPPSTEAVPTRNSIRARLATAQLFR